MTRASPKPALTHLVDRAAVMAIVRQYAAPAWCSVDQLTDALVKLFASPKPAVGVVDLVARMAWDRFAPSHNIEFAEDAHRSEYQRFASDVLAATALERLAAIPASMTDMMMTPEAVDEFTSRPDVVADIERLAGERGGEELTDVFGRPFDGEDDPRLKVAEVITRAEAAAVLEYRGDLVAALAPQPLPVEVEREENQDLMASRDHDHTVSVALEGVAAAAYIAWVAAERLRHQRTAEYNARLKVVNDSRRDGDWSAKIDFEYRQMCDASAASNIALSHLSKVSLSSAKQTRGDSSRDAPLNPKAPDHG